MIASTQIKIGESEPEERPASAPVGAPKRGAGARDLFGRVQAGCAALALRALNLCLLGLRKCLWPGRGPRDPERVCVVRHFSIGDVAVAIPAMYAIRLAFPRARLTLVTAPTGFGAGGAEGWRLLENAKWLDEVKVLQGAQLRGPVSFLTVIRDLRRRAFDTWIELPDNDLSFLKLVRNMLFARVCAPRWAHGWQLASVTWAKQAQARYLSLPHEVDRLIGLVRLSGIPADKPEFPLGLNESHRREVADLLGLLGLLEGRLVAIAPGAKRPSHRWPAERFWELGQVLSASGFGVVVVGGNEDLELCARVATEIGHPEWCLAGETTLLESCELLRRCALVICNDSGIEHLAAIVGTPCLSLFAFTSLPGQWFPYGARNRVIQKWVPCHACFKKSCPHDNLCLRLIGTREALRAAREMLES